MLWVFIILMVGEAIVFTHQLARLRNQLQAVNVQLVVLVEEVRGLRKAKANGKGNVHSIFDKPE